MPFDAYAWVLTDPETSVGSAPLAAVPHPRRTAPADPVAVPHAAEPVDDAHRPARRPAADATHGDLTRSLVWRELLARHDVSDVASVVFRDAYGCWAFLELWRTGGATSAPPTPPSSGLWCRR